jgi:hypothetical protein
MLLDTTELTMMSRTRAPRQLGALLISLSAAVTAQSAFAATVCINENAPAPLEICVKDDGTPMVWVDQSGSRVRQYYGDDDWASVIWLDGANATQRFSTEYIDANLTPVSNVVGGAGTPSDPFVMTNVTELGASGVRLTQRFTYVNGDRAFKKSWMLESTGGTTFSDVRFFHGGDTYFGGIDSARSWYDNTLKMVYVTNSSFSDTGYMGFYANPATPFARYYSGHYSPGNGHASNDAELPNTSDSDFEDAGYYLQWNRASLAPAEVWSFEAFETWSPPGVVQVLAPAEEYVSPGATVRKTFRVHNLDDTNAQTITLDAIATPSGWTVSLPNGSSIMLNPLEATEVVVDVQVPANASPGDAEEIYLTASAGSISNTGMTRLRVPVVDYAFAPAQLSFGNVPPNEQGEVELTLTNGPGGTIQIGDVAGANSLAAPFMVVSDNCSNASLAANESCTVRVRFAPTSTGNYTESFNVPVVAPTVVNHTIDVEGSSAETHTVTVASGNGGLISPSTIDVVEGGTQSFTLTPDAGYRIASVTGCNGTLVGDVYTLTAVSGACSINVTFEPATHPLTISSGSGGNISPSSIAAPHGQQVTFTITPDAGYSIASVTGCGGTLSGNAYTTAPTSGACSVSATFTKTMTDVEVTGRGQGGGGSFGLGTLLLGALLLAARRMKAGTAGAAIVATLAAASANAADVDTRGFYAGATIGQAASSESAGNLTRHLQNAGYNVQASIDDDRIGWRAFGGWALNRYIAFEGGYTDLGEVTTSYSGNIAELDVQSLLNEAVVVHPRSARGFDASVVVRYPFSSILSVSADAGAFFWDAERRVRDGAARSAHAEDDGIDIRYGVSVDATIFGNFAVIASWSRFGLKSEHIDLPGLGLRYRW